MEKQFKTLTNWIMDEDSHCAYREIKEGEIFAGKRVAFIEKTPRVLVDNNKICMNLEDGLGCSPIERDAWLYGHGGSREYGLDEDSRKWCDDMLTLLGYY